MQQREVPRPVRIGRRRRCSPSRAARRLPAAARGGGGARMASTCRCARTDRSHVAGCCVHESSGRAIAARRRARKFRRDLRRANRPAPAPSPTDRARPRLDRAPAGTRGRSAPTRHRRRPRRHTPARGPPGAATSGTARGRMRSCRPSRPRPLCPRSSAEPPQTTARSPTIAPRWPGDGAARRDRRGSDWAARGFCSPQRQRSQRSKIIVTGTECAAHVHGSDFNASTRDGAREQETREQEAAG